MSKFLTAKHAANVFFRIVNLFKPTKVIGVENIPEGPVVICPNHAHMSDPFYAVTAMPDSVGTVWVMAKEEILHWPIAGKVLDSLGFLIWVKRGKADVGAVKTALKALKGGEKLLLFPEGTRNDDIGEGKTGAAMMAIRSKVPMLPVHISPERGLFRPVTVTFGQPFDPFPEDRKATNEDYQAATDLLMEKIKGLGETGKDGGHA